MLGRAAGDGLHRRRGRGRRTRHEQRARDPRRARDRKVRAPALRRRPRPCRRRDGALGARRRARDVDPVRGAAGALPQPRGDARRDPRAARRGAGRSTRAARPGTERSLRRRRRHAELARGPCRRWLAARVDRRSAVGGRGIDRCACLRGAPTRPRGDRADRDGTGRRGHGVRRIRLSRAGARRARPSELSGAHCSREADRCAESRRAPDHGDRREPACPRRASAHAR